MSKFTISKIFKSLHPRISAGLVTIMFFVGIVFLVNAHPNSVPASNNGVVLGAQSDQLKEVTSGEIILKFSENTDDSFIEELRRYNYKKIRFPLELAAVFSGLNISEVSPLVKTKSPKKDYIGGVDNIFKITFDNLSDTDTVAASLSNHYMIDYAVKNERVEVQYVPADEYFSGAGVNSQWYLPMINAENAWDGPGGTSPTPLAGDGILVAVIDTGIDRDHTDLLGQTWVNPCEDLNGNGVIEAAEINNIDDACPGASGGNGYIDDFYGWNFNGYIASAETNDITDDNGHGTGVSGLIAGVNNQVSAPNNHGIVGLAFESTIMPLKSFESNGGGYAYDSVEAMYYAVENGADIINNSWVGFRRYQPIDDVVEYAHSQNVLVVSGAGNYPSNNVCGHFPANSEKGLSVGASDSLDQKTQYSSIGVAVDVLAPGGVFPGFSQPQMIVPSIKSSLSFPNANGDQYRLEVGTSFATPLVSAQAAILKSLNPTWNVNEIISAIRVSARDVESTGFDNLSGYGRIDVLKSLQISDAPPVAQVHEPRNCDVLSDSFKVKGVADAQNFKKYIVDVGHGTSPTSFTHLYTGNSPVNGTGLVPGGVDPKSGVFQEGVNTIRVRTYGTNGSVGEDRNEVYIDTGQKTGWPVSINTDGNSFKAPKVVDLEGDGKMDIVVGSMVFDAFGQPKPGWSGTVNGIDKATSAVADLDGDGDMEIVSVEWHGLSNDPSKPNGGAPVVYARHHDNTLLWQYEIPPYYAPLPETRFGTPSSVSIGNVDSDSDLEVTFNMLHFNTSFTKVFILDGFNGALQSPSPMTINAKAKNPISLADLDADGTDELVIPATAGKVFVLNGDGSTVPGWPKSMFSVGSPAAEVQATIADVDEDGEYEIMAGHYLFEADGSYVQNWPVSSAIAKTNATSILPETFDGDDDLEVLLGPSNYRYSFHLMDDDGGLKFNRGHDSRTNLTTYYSMFTNHGASSINGDLDGDGYPDFTASRSHNHPVMDFQVKLLGIKSLVNQDVVNFPKVVFDSMGYLQSTPTLADIDGDGLTDMVMSSEGKINAWDLGVPYDEKFNPYPMYQHDIRNTGTIPMTSRNFTIDITSNKSGATSGENVKFTVNVCSDKFTQEDITINDLIPSGLDYISGLSSYPNHVITTGINPNSSCVSQTIKTKVNSSALPGSTITNCAQMTNYDGMTSTLFPIQSCVDVDVL